MLVSLSLSPASTAAMNDKRWAFLEEIDAPQWADLKVEEALAKAGTIGDDPWFYRSHSHHEVPLTDITGVNAADIKDLNSNFRAAQLDRKKKHGTSKGKLAFDGATVTKTKDTIKEERHEESPRAVYSSGCHDTFVESPKDCIASPILCKSPENIFGSRKFITTTSDDFLRSSDGLGALQSFNSRFNLRESLIANGCTSRDSDVRNSQPEIVKSRHNRSISDSSAGQSGICEDEDTSAQPKAAWQDAIFSRLNDTSSLRKSLGSAVRGRTDGSDDASVNKQGAGTLPKSRLVRQSAEQSSAVQPAVSSSATGFTAIKNYDGASTASSRSDAARSCDVSSGFGLVNKLGVNSSVQAFDDIRRMRRSWGSALRVEVSDDSSVEDAIAKHDVPEAPPVSDAKACSPLKLDRMAIDFPSVVDLKAIRTDLVEKKLPDIEVPALARAGERRSQIFSGKGEDAESSSPRVIANGSKKNFRRSVSFDHTSGRGADKTPVPSRSSLLQQKQASRASPISASRTNGVVRKGEKVSLLSKGGKENTRIQSPSKSKLNPEPAVSNLLPRMSRQSVTRTSMPSLTFAAHARAAMRENGGSNLKPSNNGVLDTNVLDSSKAATSTATSAVRKSVSGSEIGSRKKTVATPVTVSKTPSKTRQSALRSSMPVFSSSSVKQAGNPVPETGMCHKHEQKKSNKMSNVETDLAGLQAEHNRKFRPKTKYEPRIHSVKDIREWEARTGQLFYNLPPAEREKANVEISAAKQPRLK